ncbi:MAG: putative Holliday junction resolvase [Saprospiraceae bacterium]|jgi:putative Holliday junction resolvase
MGRILAIDYGTKRVGIAETDDLQIIASPLDTIHSTKVVAFILDYASRYELEAVVIGEPRTLRNEETDSSKVINEFAVHIGRKLPGVQIDRVDERFTSKIAKQAISMSGLGRKKRQSKELVDAISATIILQSYMEQKK